MNRIILFFKGFYRAVLDSWLMLTVLIFTCIAGTVGINFCYRIVAFQFRETVDNVMYQDRNAMGYVFTSDNIAISDSLMDNEKIAAIRGNTELEVDGVVYDMYLVSEDYYGEELISDFSGEERQIVLSRDIGKGVGEEIELYGQYYTVVGLTDRTSYAPIFCFDNISGTMTVIANTQLTKAECRRLERLTGVELKSFADNASLGDSNILTGEHIIFIVLGIFVLLLTAYNLYRVFNEYIVSNDKRYRLYTMLGMSKLRLGGHIFGEGCIILTVGLVPSILIDSYIFRPLVKISGFVYMYDIFDIMISAFTLMLPFIAVMGIAIAQRVNKNARGVTEVRSRRRRAADEK